MGCESGQASVSKMSALDKIPSPTVASSVVVHHCIIVHTDEQSHLEIFIFLRIRGLKFSLHINDFIFFEFTVKKKTTVR